MSKPEISIEARYHAIRTLIEQYRAADQSRVASGREPIWGHRINELLTDLVLACENVEVEPAVRIKLDGKIGGFQ